MPKPEREPYIVQSVVHASRILDAFQAAGEALRLRDVVERTGFGKGMCFRLLHTLHHCGLLEKVDASRYRLVSPIQRRKRYRLGYGAQGQDTSFAREVRASLERAAEREGAELIVVDNRYQPKVALRNAEHLIREDWIPYRVSLLGNYGTDLALKREINRFLLAEDPYGTVAFVRFGIERGELRSNLDLEMTVSIVDWTMERFQDALVTEELDPGLFRRGGEVTEKKETRIAQFLDILQRAIGAEPH